MGRPLLTFSYSGTPDVVTTSGSGIYSAKLYLAIVVTSWLELCPEVYISLITKDTSSPDSNILPSASPIIDNVISVLDSVISLDTNSYYQVWLNLY